MNKRPNKPFCIQNTIIEHQQMLAIKWTRLVTILYWSALTISFILYHLTPHARTTQTFFPFSWFTILCFYTDIIVLSTPKYPHCITKQRRIVDFHLIHITTEYLNLKCSPNISWSLNALIANRCLCLICAFHLLLIKFHSGWLKIVYEKSSSPTTTTTSKSRKTERTKRGRCDAQG